MGTRWTRSWGASLLMAGMAGASALPAMAVGAAPGPGTALAVIVDGTSTEATAAAVRAVGGVVVSPLEIIGGVAATVPGSALGALQGAGLVVSTDATVGPTASSPTSGPPGDGSDVNAQVTALHPGVTGGPGAGAGTTVGLIDTGIAPHEDLAGRLQAGIDLSGGSGGALTDGYGHGTFMAGLIAGTRTGVAPGADIVSIKVAGDDGTTTLRTLIEAIGWAVVHQDHVGIDVVNLSLGTVSPMAAPADPLAQAVEAAWAAGLTVVVASGNEGPGTVTSPGTSESALTIGATDHRGTASPDDDVVAPWSGSDPKRHKPDLVAPGTSLISLRAPGSVVDLANVDNQIQTALGSGYFVGSGTSMATALGAGAAAVVLAAHPDATPGDVKSALVDTAVPLPGGGATIDLETAATLMSAPDEVTAPAPGRAGPGRASISDRSAIGWSGARWTGARWTGARWTGARWTEASWTEASWAGARWTGARWTGARWTDGEWAGARWTGARWTGARWTGARWTGARWTGARWTMAAVADGVDQP